MVGYSTESSYTPILIVLHFGSFTAGIQRDCNFFLANSQECNLVGIIVLLHWSLSSYAFLPYERPFEGFLTLGLENGETVFLFLLLQVENSNGFVLPPPPFKDGFR
jgi:hypothetical protein